MKKIPNVKLLLALPGPSWYGTVVQALLRTMTELDFDTVPISFIGAIGNFNNAWAFGLNAAMKNEFTHFAMLHSDVEPASRWLNTLLDVLLRDPSLGLVSAPVAIKDEKGLLSCGLGDTTDPWWPWRRLTTLENSKLPKITREADLWHLWYGNDADSRDFKRPSGTYLLHNNGCWVADLRKPEWHVEVDTGYGGKAIPNFNFPVKVERKKVGVRKTPGKPDEDLIEYKHVGEPEDFHFSRMAYLAGIQSAIVTNVETKHWQGNVYFSSHAINRPGERGGQWAFDHWAGNERALTRNEKATLALQEANWR